MTLNLAATTKLAWQQRKAESFTVTPQFCGCAGDELGYRRTKEYGNPRDDGISVGTAMAISGAAVSPNMGYHSWPSIAFLLTLLNVRLGWWLGNPGHRGGQDGRLSAFVKKMITLARQSEYLPPSGRGGGISAAVQRIVTWASRSLDPSAPYRRDAPWLSLRPLLVSFSA
jgi:hypothetical protein